MTPGDEMLDAEQVIRDAIIESPVIAPGDEPYTGWSADLAGHVLAALSSNGFHVFSERELWAYVRERVLADEARDVATDAYWHSFRERSPAMRSALAAAIDHGEQRGKG